MGLIFPFTEPEKILGRLLGRNEGCDDLWVWTRLRQLLAPSAAARGCFAPGRAGGMLTAQGPMGAEVQRGCGAEGCC